MSEALRAELRGQSKQLGTVTYHERGKLLYPPKTEHSDTVAEHKKGKQSGECAVPGHLPAAQCSSSAGQASAAVGPAESLPAQSVEAFLITLPFI